MSSFYSHALRQLLTAIASGEVRGDGIEAIAAGIEQAAEALADSRAHDAVVSFATAAMHATDVEAHMRNTLAQYAMLGHVGTEGTRRTALLALGAPDILVSEQALKQAAEDCQVYGHMNSAAFCARCGADRRDSVTATDPEEEPGASFDAWSDSLERYECAPNTDTRPTLVPTGYEA